MIQFTLALYNFAKKSAKIGAFLNLNFAYLRKSLRKILPTLDFGKSSINST